MNQTEESNGLTLTDLLDSEPTVHAHQLRRTGPPGPATQLPTSEVGSLVLDSRRAGPGSIWAALPGTRTHGARFAAEPFAAPVLAVLTDAEGLAILAQDQGDRSGAPPVLVTDDPRGVMARMAARIAGHPAEDLTTYGITGTNGKTTVSYLLQAALRACGHRTGVIGTVGFRLDDSPVAGVHTSTVTTPESPDLQRILADLVTAGADTLAMEVSSHALAQQRVGGIRFDVAGFNNLGEDHLDFHHDLADYFAAKARLFGPDHCRRAVINIDDEYGRALAEQVTVPITRVSLDDPDEAEVGVRRWRATTAGSEVTFTLAAEVAASKEPVDLPAVTVGLPGIHNVRNALLALGMVVAAGVDDPAVAATGFAEVRVPGRMEAVHLAAPAGADSQAPPQALVDFAHTPQAVEAAGNALEAAARPLVAVVGAGGDRDPGKRGPIGAAAARAADVVIVTDDNPRTEPPQLIRDQVRAGADQARALGARARHVIDGGDRRSAIRRALEIAADPERVGLAGEGPGTVLILGRGHETHQLTAEGPVEFHDPTVVAQQWQVVTESHRRSESGGKPSRAGESS